MSKTLDDLKRYYEEGKLSLGEYTNLQNRIAYLEHRDNSLNQIMSANSSKAMKILQKLATIPLNIDDEHWTTLSTQDDFKELENFILQSQADKEKAEKELAELVEKIIIIFELDQELHIKESAAKWNQRAKLKREIRTLSESYESVFCQKHRSRKIFDGENFYCPVCREYGKKWPEKEKGK